MTKRAFPQDFGISRQFKIHLNEYDNDANALKNLKEQTLRKLFEGSKNFYSEGFKTNSSETASDSIFPQDDKHFTQKSITNYFACNGTKPNGVINCIIGGSDTVSRCYFCDVKTNLTNQCIKCLEYFCSACTFNNYESNEETRICLSCS